MADIVLFCSEVKLTQVDIFIVAGKIEFWFIALVYAIITGPMNVKFWDYLGYNWFIVFCMYFSFSTASIILIYISFWVVFKINAYYWSWVVWLCNSLPCVAIARTATMIKTWICVDLIIFIRILNYIKICIYIQKLNIINVLRCE